MKSKDFRGRRVAQGGGGGGGRSPLLPWWLRGCTMHWANISTRYIEEIVEQDVWVCHLFTIAYKFSLAVDAVIGTSYPIFSETIPN